jgi:GntR family transcriptional repressor for pyruvate dehydrogenase complex
MDHSTGKRIQEEIIQMIRSGGVNEGDRLPAERVLSQRFNVSRNTVREAIRALAEQGLIISRRGSGSYVASNAREQIEDIFKSALKGRQLKVMEIFEIRRMLEPMIAAKVAETADKETLTALEHILDCQQRVFAKGESGTALDITFHRTLVKAAGNTALEAVYDTLGKIMAESRIPDLQSPERASYSVASHQRLLACLKAADAKGALRAMAQHMDEIECILKQILKENLK